MMNTQAPQVKKSLHLYPFIPIDKTYLTFQFKDLIAFETVVWNNVNKPCDISFSFRIILWDNEYPRHLIALSRLGYFIIRGTHKRDRQRRDTSYLVNVGDIYYSRN
jgi:hypothetical protein